MNTSLDVGQILGVNFPLKEYIARGQTFLYQNFQKYHQVAVSQLYFCKRTRITQYESILIWECEIKSRIFLRKIIWIKIFMHSSHHMGNSQPNIRQSSKFNNSRVSSQLKELQRLYGTRLKISSQNHWMVDCIIGGSGFQLLVQVFIDITDFPPQQPRIYLAAANSVVPAPTYDSQYYLEQYFKDQVKGGRRVEIEGWFIGVRLEMILKHIEATIRQSLRFEQKLKINVKGAVGDKQARETAQKTNKCTIRTIDKEDWSVCFEFEPAKWSCLYREDTTIVIGLANQGGVCYANALLQMLFQMVELRIPVILFPGNEAITKALSETFRMMQTATNEWIYQTKQITQILYGFNQGKTYSADTFIFFQHLLEKTQNTNNSFELMINALIGHTLKKTRICNCQTVQTEQLSELTIDIYEKVTSSMKQYFDQCKNGFKFVCDRCNSQMGRVTTQFYSLPSYLLVHINRQTPPVSYSWSSCGNKRQSPRTESNFKAEQAFELNNTVYEYYASVMHTAYGASSGHYKFIMKRSKGGFYEINDHEVKRGVDLPPHFKEILILYKSTNKKPLAVGLPITEPELDYAVQVEASLRRPAKR